MNKQTIRLTILLAHFMYNHFIFAPTTFILLISFLMYTQLIPLLLNRLMFAEYKERKSYDRVQPSFYLF